MSKIKKYISAFLSVYMIALMFLPCNDTCASHQDDVSVTFQSMQDHHEADNDICSPFCFCSCCATAMTVLPFPVFNIIPHFAVKNFTAFNQSFPSLEYSSIWQPPKLV